MTYSVDSIFEEIPSYYDRMNDLMSFGLHRIWKDHMVSLLRPLDACSVYVDLATGTGDIALRLLPQKKPEQTWFLIDPSYNMLTQARTQLAQPAHILCAHAEHLPLADNSVDRLTFSFGLRNTYHRAQALQEIHRILHPSGQAVILEFHPPSALGAKLFKLYSRCLPYLGQLCAQDADSYAYLRDSIEEHPPQTYCAALMRELGFEVQTSSMHFGLLAYYTIEKTP